MTSRPKNISAGVHHNWDVWRLLARADASTMFLELFWRDEDSNVANYQFEPTAPLCDGMVTGIFLDAYLLTRMRFECLEWTATSLEVKLSLVFTHQNMHPQPPPIPPVLRPGISIQYSLTRGDIFRAGTTVIFRNRIVQIFVIGVTLLNGWWTLAPEFNERTILENISHAIAFLIIFLGIIAVVQCVFSAASAMLQNNRGVLGQHILEITNDGLIERTDANETLHKWAAIQRIISTSRNLYIYTGSENFHLVPKRSFSTDEIAHFERELRARANVV
ncbi:MAG: YcxB family protein [Limisphaerales bacterium]